MPVNPIISGMLELTVAQSPDEPADLTIQEQRDAAEVRDWAVSRPHSKFTVRVFTPEGAGPFPDFTFFTKRLPATREGRAEVIAALRQAFTPGA